MNEHVHRIESHADLPAAIVAATQVGAIGEAILLRALHQGRIAHWQILPGTGVGVFKQFAAATRDCPTVAVIPGDDYTERGPEAWPAAKRAIRWAAHVVVHAAGADPEHYHRAIAAALLCRRVLLIECCSATVKAWSALVQAAPHRPSVLLVIPDNPHPVMPARGAMQ